MANEDLRPQSTADDNPPLPPRSAEVGETPQSLRQRAWGAIPVVGMSMFWQLIYSSADLRIKAFAILYQAYWLRVLALPPASQLRDPSIVRRGKWLTNLCFIITSHLTGWLLSFLTVNDDSSLDLQVYFILQLIGAVVVVLINTWMQPFLKISTTGTLAYMCHFCTFVCALLYFVIGLPQGVSKSMFTILAFDLPAWTLLLAKAKTPEVSTTAVDHDQETITREKPSSSV